MKSIITICLLLMLLLLTYSTAILFCSPYLNSSDHEIDYYSKELNSLKKEMHLGIAKKMQKIYPEGYIFTNVLYGLSAIELVRKIEDPIGKKVWQTEARWAISEIGSDYGTSIFDNNLNPAYGTFYHSWKTWLTGKYLSILDKNNIDTVLYENFQKDCNAILKYYLVENNPYPETYKGISWPGDAIVGIAAMKLSDKEFHTDYSKFIEKWISAVKLNLTASSHLIPHSTQQTIPNSIKSSRGSSQSLILCLLYDIDHNFALEQYKIFKDKFVDSFLFFSLIKESEPSRNQDEDIDSGPIIFGFGSVASIVGIGTSKFYGDKTLFSDLNLVVEFSKIPAKYFISDNTIADLFILWSRISEPLITQTIGSRIKDFANIKYIFLMITILYTAIMIVALKLIWVRRSINLVNK